MAWSRRVASTIRRTRHAWRESGSRSRDDSVVSEPPDGPHRSDRGMRPSDIPNPAKVDRRRLLEPERENRSVSDASFPGPPVPWMRRERPASDRGIEFAELLDDTLPYAARSPRFDRVQVMSRCREPLPTTRSGSSACFTRPTGWSTRSCPDSMKRGRLPASGQPSTSFLSSSSAAVPESVEPSSSHRSNQALARSEDRAASSPSKPCPAPSNRWYSASSPALS